jgi:DNA-binding HxlR family transcriptional regulator
MDDTPSCASFEAIQLLQQKWNMHIIRALLSGPMGFNELGRAIGGCSPATLAKRLDRLEALELVAGTVVQVMPPRTSYRLTEMGLELEDVIAAIARWAKPPNDRRAGGSGGPDRRCAGGSAAATNPPPPRPQPRRHAAPGRCARPSARRSARRPRARCE